MKPLGSKLVINGSHVSSGYVESGNSKLPGEANDK